MSALYILHSDGKWRPVELSNMYNVLYSILQSTLNQWQSKGTAASEAVFQPLHVYKYRVDILRVESHRACTVLFCLQRNPQGGERFLAYGTKYNLDHDYGIGISLEDINLERASKYCPPGVTKFVDAPTSSLNKVFQEAQDRAPPSVNRRTGEQRNCYCKEKNSLDSFCGVCDDCKQKGHCVAAPPPIPASGCYCDDCWDKEAARVSAALEKGSKKKILV